MKNMWVVTKFLWGMAVLCMVPSLYGWTIRNRTGQTVKIKATYWGETSFSCRPDEFDLAPHATIEKHAGLCALSSLTSGNGAYGIQGIPSGSKFSVIVDGSGYRIVQED